jgi:L-methionine (R)-S-oxide reductase
LQGGKMPNVYRTMRSKAKARWDSQPRFADSAGAYTRLEMTAEREKLIQALQQAMKRGGERAIVLWEIADLIRPHGAFRWVGLYDVDYAAGMVRNIVWSGPGAPEYPTFPISKGLTGSAIAERRLINVADVTRDPRYLRAFESTRSEIIVPIFDRQGRQVVGTLDVESQIVNAFGAKTQELLQECARMIQPLWS